MTEEQFNEWIETQPIEDKLVYLKYKYSQEEEWTFSKEILEVDMYADGCYVWLNDWYEGQQDVEILGCIAISDIDVPAFAQADTPQTEILVKTPRISRESHEKDTPQTDCGWK